MKSKNKIRLGLIVIVLIMIPIILTAIIVGSVLIFCVVILGLYLETSNSEKKINQYITIKLKNGRTYIYVNGKRFIQCIQLVLNIPKEDIRIYDEVDSIDEAVKLNKAYLYQHNIIGGHFNARRKNYRYKITAKEKFWGHCSNIQAWVEHGYDTRILMSNISFPLLRELVKAGDPVAREVIKEEIAMRLESGYPSVIQYLLNQGFVGYSNTSEFKTVDLEMLLENLKKSREIISEDPNELGKIDATIEAIEKLLEKMKGRQELRTNASFHYKFMVWVLLLGDLSTGIEELTSYYLHGDRTNYKFTIGAQFFSRMSNFQNNNVKLLFWDVAVEERFRFLFPSFLRNKHGVIIMYDITNSKTLNRISEWVQLIRERNGDIPIMLIGNKVDLEENREVSREEVKKIVEKYNLTTSIEISTKTGENVEEVFTKLTKFIMEHIQEKSLKESSE